MAPELLFAFRHTPLHLKATDETYKFSEACAAAVERLDPYGIWLPRIMGIRSRWGDQQPSGCSPACSCAHSKLHLAAQHACVWDTSDAAARPRCGSVNLQRARASTSHRAVRCAALAKARPVRDRADAGREDAMILKGRTQ
jgi:hypothetical protein